MSENTEKKKALEMAMSQIEKQFGKGSVMKLGEFKAMEVEAIPTGALSLDIALGIGGVPRGRIIEIFGPESSGKTTLAAHLENNLIIDLEGGSEFIDCLAVQARNINDLGEIANAIRQKNKECNGYFYKYITIDNATRLEEITLSYALTLYNQTPMGKSYKGDVRLLPQGGGWFYVRQAVRKVLDMFRELCENFILIGHTKDKLVNKDGEELSEMELDLAGKLSNIICGEADAIAYISRKKNQTIASFKGGENITIEARAPHLRGQNIVIAESDDEGKISVYWDKIYLPDQE